MTTLVGTSKAIIVGAGATCGIRSGVLDDFNRTRSGTNSWTNSQIMGFGPASSGLTWYAQGDSDTDPTDSKPTVSCNGSSFLLAQGASGGGGQSGGNFQVRAADWPWARQVPFTVTCRFQEQDFFTNFSFGDPAFSYGHFVASGSNSILNCGSGGSKSAIYTPSHFAINTWLLAKMNVQPDRLVQAVIYHDGDAQPDWEVTLPCSGVFAAQEFTMGGACVPNDTLTVDYIRVDLG